MAFAYKAKTLALVPWDLDLSPFSETKLSRDRTSCPWEIALYVARAHSLPPLQEEKTFT
jgi:hypothetical protein